MNVLNVCYHLTMSKYIFLILQCENFVIFIIRFLELAKFNNLIPLSLVSECILLLPIVGWKMFSRQTFTLQCENFVIFVIRFLELAKFNNLIPLLLLSECVLSLLIVGWKMFSRQTFTLKSPNSIFL